MGLYGLTLQKGLKNSHTPLPSICYYRHVPNSICPNCFKAHTYAATECRIIFDCSAVFDIYISSFLNRYFYVTLEFRNKMKLDDVLLYYDISMAFING